MADIDFSGLDDIEDLLQNMKLTERDKTKSMREAIKPVYEKTNNATPMSSGRLKKSEEMLVRKEDLATVGIVRYGVFWDRFNEFEYGGSRNKSHVGFFDRAVKNSTNAAVKILANNLFEKIK